ncbi:hypothetical protein G7Y89_g9435 [Cudoniella acicularis]|uniref:Uncharacterized protein n=1 Tax=Cudoniella acicularis TaxID=354080 RepID=A0A8H4RFM1_9HELO|nr:hypothetical protein G7Y89_g9435 [Cudoniella acicularis]
MAPNLLYDFLRTTLQDQLDTTPNTINHQFKYSYLRPPISLFPSTEDLMDDDVQSLRNVIKTIITTCPEGKARAAQLWQGLSAAEKKDKVVLENLLRTLFKKSRWAVARKLSGGKKVVGKKFCDVLRRDDMDSAVVGRSERKRKDGGMISAKGSILNATPTVAKESRRKREESVSEGKKEKLKKRKETCPSSPISNISFGDGGTVDVLQELRGRNQFIESDDDNVEQTSRIPIKTYTLPARSTSASPIGNSVNQASNNKKSIADIFEAEQERGIQAAKQGKKRLKEMATEKGGYPNVESMCFPFWSAKTLCAVLILWFGEDVKKWFCCGYPAGDDGCRVAMHIDEKQLGALETVKKRKDDSWREARKRPYFICEECDEDFLNPERFDDNGSSDDEEGYNYYQVWQIAQFPVRSEVDDGYVSQSDATSETSDEVSDNEEEDEGDRVNPSQKPQNPSFVEIVKKKRTTARNVVE